jgi:polysaccharide deacetylase family protein (PEP-CTERM system associated)
MAPRKSILLTIDVEDWFQVENFRKVTPISSWSQRELRVEQNTHHILDLLDSHTCRTSVLQDNSQESSIQNPPFDKQIKATFFVLGWIAGRLPSLVQEIHKRGHEVASHGYYHRLSKEEPIGDFKEDLYNSKKLIEDTIGAPVFGYRAPSFSINNDILRVIAACGYTYDSSYNSFGLNSRYGHIDLSGCRRCGIALQICNGFVELPISNININNYTLPWGGGGYFRLVPLFLFKKGVRLILNKEKAYLLYMHPWEIDPGQPRVKEAPALHKFRQYVNLTKTSSKLSALLEAFGYCSFLSCFQYLKIANCHDSSIPKADIPWAGAT